MNKHEVNDKLKSINELHPSFTFTCERGDTNCNAFLDMKIIIFAPKKYKRSVVSGFVYRIFTILVVLGVSLMTVLRKQNLFF